MEVSNKYMRYPVRKYISNLFIISVTMKAAIQLFKKSPAFLNNEGSSQCSQKPATGFYRKPIESYHGQIIGDGLRVEKLGVK
jgi:hypothetical protein